MSSVEQGFDRNVATYRECVTKLRGMSSECLGRLTASEERFDVIHVDGPHISPKAR